MNIKRCFAVASVATASIVVACSSGSGSTAGAADSGTFVAEICALYAPCCGKVNKPTDGAQCRAFYGAATSASKYDSAKGSDCLAELRALQSNTDFCENGTSKATSCKRAFKQGSGGTKAPGEDCADDGECAPSAEGEAECATSYGSSATTTKACQIQVDGKEGDTPCVATRDGNTTFGVGSFTSGDAGAPRPPAKGYVCDLANKVFCDSKTDACTKIQEVGATCDTSNTRACVAGAYCDFATKKCLARLAVGADCSKSPSSCVEKSTCDTATKTCLAGLPDGSPCTSGSKCGSSSCINGKCGGSSSGGLTTQLLCGN
jgi:hypothetical protein